jgi:PIN domain nuclease of toxin-antitoxin system
MNLLLDTHILLWHLADNPKLSLDASDLIENNAHQKFLSIVSLWEIEIKRNIANWI